MKIAYVFGNKWPKQSAGINYTTYTCYGLASSEASPEVELIMEKNSDESPEYILERDFDIEKNSGLKMKLFPKLRFIPDKSSSFYIRVYLYLKKKASKGELDAVISRNEGFLPYMHKLKQKFGVKVYYEPHQFFLDPKINPEKNKFKKRYFQKRYMPLMNGIICHQSEIANLYKNYLPEANYFVAHSGLNRVISGFNPWENIYLAYIGTIDKRKKLGDILKAMSISKNKEIKFLIIGQRKNENLDEFMEEAEKLGVKDRVEVTGWLSHRELESVLTKVKIGVVPLEDTFFNKYLTSPMKIFNYLSAGIPVIASDLPSVRDILSDGEGLFYEDGDIERLAKCIDLICEDEKKYMDIHRKILEKAENLLWKKRGDRIYEFISCS